MVTVVYSDSDDGASQERLIATSGLEYGDGATLGRRLSVPDSRARCVFGEGVLVRRSPEPPRANPLLFSEP